MTGQHSINNLFLLFHDFQIVKLEYLDDKLSLTMKIPWGQLWNDYDFKIKLEISGCNFIECVHGEIIQNPDNLALMLRKSIDKVTTDPLIISNLLLEVQRHASLDENAYKFFCNSSNPKCSGGELTFTATQVQVVDMAGQEITLLKMEKWFSEFWKDPE